jgi:DNA-binding Lrp family transcriptional regulator
MQILIHTKLDNLIVKNLLENGAQEITDLHTALNSQGQTVTIQGVYKRIRQLISDGVVLKNKKTVAINSEWAENLQNLLDNVLHTPGLKTGESIIYSFKRLSPLDAYWKHVMAPLEISFAGYPIFLYNPYEIWIDLSDRKNSEVNYFQAFAKEQRYCFCSLGKQNYRNQAFKKEYQSKYLQVSVGDENFSDRDYIAVIADYIITTKLTPALAKSINFIYASDNKNSLSEKVEALFSGSTAIKLKIERNENKAKRFRKKISKDFYIPKEVSEKYNLF